MTDTSIINQLYNVTVRQVLPKKIGMFDGVAVRRPRLFDRQDTFDGHEEALLKALRNQLQPTDEVVIVGGGIGVSTVIAARGGQSVTVFEASAEQLEVVNETVSLNAVEDSVTLSHSVVGPEISLYGARGDPDQVSPDELPQCDILELDCEGAELKILQEMKVNPRCIIVECHACFDAPEKEVRTVLDQLNYTVVNRAVEVDEKGINVLTAVRADMTIERGERQN